MDRPTVAVLQHAVDRLGDRAVEGLVKELERRGEADAVWIVDLLARIGAKGIDLMGASLTGCRHARCAT